MDRMEKIHALLNDLDVLMQAEFPGYTNGSFTISPDGYRCMAVVEIANEPGVPLEKQRCLYLHEQSCHHGKWDEPNTNGMNEYLKKNGKLMEDDYGDQDES